MKSTAKNKTIFLLNILIIKPICLLIKRCAKPSEKLMKKMKFIGKFKITTKDDKIFYLYNNTFFLENSIFWLGMENFTWEFMTRQIWIHLSKSSKIIFDIGANTGIYSILSKVYNPNAKVSAFEPQPNIYKILKKTIT